MLQVRETAQVKPSAFDRFKSILPGARMASTNTVGRAAVNTEEKRNKLKAIHEVFTYVENMERQAGVRRVKVKGNDNTKFLNHPVLWSDTRVNAQYDEFKKSHTDILMPPPKDPIELIYHTAMKKVFKILNT